MREIATWCHQHDTTVRLHLQVRDKYQPDLRTMHETALAARGNDRPTTGWRRRHAEAVDFVDDHGRLPDTNSSIIAEQSLAGWITVQQLAANRGELSTAKRILMGDLPGWDASPRQALLDENWRARFG
ncbi:hypothetical protein CVV68_01625 [Arthrobacter livingstonensis]|uniref:Helicase-associated domain-containing protein n=1 Tax=Arthrobacter livingstonensis TaxID=670078 RepID=A0A2V5LDL6_9MICC|nr:hypothetical protein [Arthrobacter livingstonensis]PYI69831.1 hypothetical protein CVV68_01625 [Arthrobacter livingstonensis]